MAAAENADDNPINIGRFIEQWQDVLSQDQMKGGYNDDPSLIRESTNTDPQIINELETVCSVDTLSCPGEPKDIELLLTENPKNIPDLELSSTKACSEDLEKRAKEGAYKLKILQTLKYKHRRPPGVHIEKSDEKDAVSPVEVPDALVTIAICRPFHRGKKTVVDQEVLVLGGQLLSEVRDSIFCISDQMTPGDYSTGPNVKPEIKTMDVYKSGFFFIEGVFYNDLRDADHKDNSKVICDWAAKENIGTYERKQMSETTLKELNVRLGQPYLYQHQGSCEHVIVFSDVRLVHKEDCQDVSKYPITTFQRIFKRIVCRVCQMYLAKWVTKESQLTPEDPCFYCNTCFQAFHYDVYGKKLFDFKAYHYPDKFTDTMSGTT